MNSLVHVPDIFVSHQTEATYSPQTFSVTAAIVAPAVAICLNSLMFVSYGATPTVCDIYRSNLNFDLATFLLVLCFTLVFKGRWYKEDPN